MPPLARTLALLLLALLPLRAPAQQVTHTRLDNALACTIAEHDAPGGAVWLQIDAGSLREPAGLNGLAHLLQRMAFEGSAHFAPGQARREFAPGYTAHARTEHATTGYDRVEFCLALDDPGDLDRALLFCADVLTGLDLDPAALEAQRDALLELLRMSDGPDRRAHERLLAAVGGASYADRWPWGAQRDVAAITGDDLRAFWRDWYTPANARLIVVAPDADAALAAVRARLGEIPPRPAPAWHAAPAPEPADPIVVQEPGLRAVTAALLRAGPAHAPPADTRALAESVTLRLADARLRQRAADGTLPATATKCSADDLASGARLVFAQADGADGAELLAALRTETELLRRFGVTADELDDAWRALIAELTAEASADAPPSRVAAWHARRAAQGLPPAAPGEVLAAARRLAADDTPESASRRLATLLDLRGAHVAIQGPPGPWLPTPDAAVDADGRARASVPSRPPAPPPEIDLAALIPTAPEPGAVAELSAHPALGVTSVRLSNGVRVHHKPMGATPGRVTARLALGLGPADESPAQRGLTEAAAAALARPAFGGATRAQVARAMEARGLHLWATASAEGLHLVVDAPADRVGEALALLREVATAGEVDADAMRRWTATRAIELHAEAHDAQGALRNALSAAWHAPGSPWQPMDPAQPSRLTPADAAAWLARLRAAPAVVSIVGDVSWPEAIEAAAAHLGALPARPHPSPASPSPDPDGGGITRSVTEGAPRGADAPPGAPWSERREGHAPSPPGGEGGVKGAPSNHPIRSHDRPESDPPSSGVAIALAGPGWEDLSTARALSVAAALLAERLADDPPPGARWTAAEYAFEHPAGGRLQALALCDPADAEAVANALASAIDALATEGPTRAEVDSYAQRSAGYVEHTLTSAAIWSARLCSLELAGHSVDAMATMRADYASLTPERIRGALSHAVAAGPALRVAMPPTDARP